MMHARLSGSKAEQFIACSAAPQLIELVGPEVDADEPDYRRDGIAAHEVAAECLRSDQDAWAFIGDARFPFFEKEHVLAVQMYADYVREQAGNWPLMVEQYVDDPDFEDFGGTLDAAWVKTTREGCEATVVDYKHGAGLSVEPSCAQLFYYAFGLLLKRPNVTHFRLVIVQPRAWHKDGPIREHLVSAADVHQWAIGVLHPAMEQAQSKGARFVPGNHCRFCPVKLACPALMGMARAVAEGPAVGVYTPRELTDEQLAAEGELIKPAQMYFRAVMAEISRRTFAGHLVPGFKAVAKKADRVWVNESEAVEAATRTWGAEVWTPTQLISPAQIDKLPGGKEFTARYARSPETGYTIASEDDKRAAVKVTSVPAGYQEKAE